MKGIEGEEVINLHDPGAEAAGGDFCCEVATFEADEAGRDRCGLWGGELLLSSNSP